MSKMTIHNLECPHCGNKQETKVWHSVNVKLDPELKRKLFDAQINMFSCEKCGKKTFINTPLLYHDMTQQFFVQYYPPESLDQREFFQCRPAKISGGHSNPLKIGVITHGRSRNDLN